MNMKKRVFVDMDGVLVDFESALAKTPPETLAKYGNRRDKIPGLFGMMDPMPGAIEAWNRLCAKYDVHILSTAPWDNPTAWHDKRVWVEKYLGPSAYKRLTLSHNKHLLRGDYLIDDRTANGAGEFEGELIQFGNDNFPNWETVLGYLEA
jgi:5'(3')-deoxyribonucleotidase